ncbi:hypothetical protein FQR65_LT09087 [Abscondita terminalis]|nr:hypothetical protein FQR65_LT09087 [Abscondita terminalis]
MSQSYVSPGSKVKPDTKKSKISSEQTDKPKKKGRKRIKASDYAAWEKFDAEAECAKLDEENDIDSGDLTDEVDEDAHDNANYEKEKGNNFVKQQKWDQAIACYTKAIEYYAYDPIFYANRALCYLKIENYKEAESDCTSALQLDKTYVKAYQRRAAAREALNQLTEAHSDLLKVFDYEPNNKESKNALLKLEKKLGSVNSKPKVEATNQRPKSKFTMFHQQRKQPVKPPAEIKTKTVVPSDELNNTETYWASGNDIELIKPINKSPHLRSKKPLKRISILNIDTVNENDKTPKLDKKIQAWPRPGIDNKIINCDDLKIIERKIELDVPKEIKTILSNNSKSEKLIDFEMSSPTTSIQFSSDWRLIEKDDDLRYKYLKQIDPNKIPTLFKESLDCEVFSGILSTLSKSFIEHNDSVYDYLLKLSEVKRFSMLKMFMTDSDKESISKLSTYMSGSKNLIKNEVNSLISKYTL